MLPERVLGRFAGAAGPGLPLSLLLVALWCTSADAQRRGGPPPTPGVVIADICRMHPVAEQTFVGTVTPIRSSTIGSAVEGRVQRVLVDEGDRVVVEESGPDAMATGQPLVQLRTSTLQIEIDSAEAELSIRQQALAELTQSLPDEQAQAEAVVEEMKSRLTLAQADFERMRDLFDSGGGVSQKDFDTAVSEVGAARFSLKAAEALAHKVESTRKARLAQANARVAAQQSEIRRLEDLKSKYTIRAPFTGYVVAKLTEEGQWVQRGADVMSVIQLDPIEVTIGVPQSVLDQVQQALAEGKGEGESAAQVHAVVHVSGADPIEGRVSKLIPQADLRSRTFPLRIEVPNPRSPYGHLFKAGMIAEVDLSFGSPTSGLYVKKDALVLGGREPVVFVTDTDEQGKTIARPVTVKTGRTLEDLIEVEGDLKEGDQVVVEGNERLAPPRPGPDGRLVFQEVRVLGEVDATADLKSDK